tara:strand:- start:310 stop:636 length:327 start_codon:yes stop_codon:yes gene_type:complete
MTELSYQNALESEQKVAQLIAAIDKSVVQIRQYQTEYSKDIVDMDARIIARSLPDIDKRVRTVKFLQQLLQMEFDQLRQRDDLKSRLWQAKCMTATALQKLKVSIGNN